MADRKTLGLKDTSDAEPTLNKKGRGWKISDKRLDELHDRAREMRRFASPANQALAKRRDKSLESVCFRVMRIKASDILENMDAVLQRITAGMRIRIEDKRNARRDHFNRS